MARNRETMLGTIRALLEKTKERGATESEELAALAKARALMDAYEITDEDLQLTKEEGAILRDESDDLGDPHGIKWRLAYGVGKFCGVTIYRSRRDEGRKFVFVGLRADCDLAEFLLCDHLCEFVQMELARYLMSSVAPRSERRTLIANFVRGATSRIGDRLDELARQSEAARTSNGRALVVIQGKAIKDKLAAAGIRLRTGRLSDRGQYDDAAFSSGKAAGDRATFGRPVDGERGVIRIGRA
jgi:hypothetical protein